jgi:glycosyltransferase involved in cell wall biosynthesis
MVRLMYSNSGVETPPKVSIGLPVFNGEKTIGLALHSILSQDYQNFEVIISDNCSTDGTEAIAQSYCKSDSRFRYYRQTENLGLIQNFNDVFKSTNGEFFFWASHDDFRSPNFISSCLKRLMEDPKAVLCSPKLEFKVPSEPKVIWTADLGTFHNKKSLVSRYRETLANFPAAAIYGLYRSSALIQTDMLKKCIASDLIFIQNLSMYGTFIHSNDCTLTYVGRESWNSVKQDYFTFYGSREIPRFFSPFLSVFATQIKVIRDSKLKWFSKLELFVVLFVYQTTQFLKKTLLKVIKLVSPKKLREPLVMFLYWKYFHSRNVQAKEFESYRRRVILPCMGLTHN